MTHEDVSLELPSCVLGSFLGFNEQNQPLVDFAGNETGDGLPALTCVQLTRDLAGCEVALSYINGDRRQPIILGVLARHTAKAELITSAHDELTIQCGKASITLTKAGKILIQGEYIASQSNGVNQMGGASVQIN